MTRNGTWNFCDVSNLKCILIIFSSLIQFFKTSCSLAYYISLREGAPLARKLGFLPLQASVEKQNFDDLEVDVKSVFILIVDTIRSKKNISVHETKFSKMGYKASPNQRFNCINASVAKNFVEIFKSDKMRG